MEQIHKKMGGKTVEDPIDGELYLTCDHCEKSDSTVHETIDPFMDEVYDKRIPVNLCDDCYQERKDEV